MQNFRDLRVWQAGMDLVEQVYKLTSQFLKHEIYGLCSQMQSAAVSVPANIAEGHTREHTKEYLHHLSIAQASLAELQTLLEISRRLSYTAPDGLMLPQEQSASLTRQIYALRNALSNH